jgi:hypothetical protein
MSDEKYLNNLKGSNDRAKIELLVRDPDGVLVELLKHIGSAANVGHSFKVVVDPEDKEYAKDFWIDGDGSFHLKEIKVNGIKET